MDIYFITIAALIVGSSIALAFVFSKNNLFNLRVVLAITGSSVVVTLLFPVIFGIFSNLSSLFSSKFGIILSYLASFIIYFVLIFFFSLFISSFISDERSESIEESIKCLASKVGWQKLCYATGSWLKPAEDGQYTEIPDVSPADTEQGKNILEKSVDSEQNTDKMGLGEIGHNNPKIDNIVEILEIYDVLKNPEDVNAMDETLVADSEAGYAEVNLVFEDEAMFFSDETEATVESAAESVAYAETQVAVEQTYLESPKGNMQEYTDHDLSEESSVEDLINEAFRLKEKGDLEGAIIYYMYALDKEPEKDLVFLVVLDICVLYKTLGQIELAREILKSYVDNYGDLMDEAVKYEIEKNLSYA